MCLSGNSVLCVHAFSNGDGRRTSCCVCGWVGVCECALWSCLYCVGIEMSTESRGGCRDPPTHGRCGCSNVYQTQTEPRTPSGTHVPTQGDKQRGKERQKGSHTEIRTYANISTYAVLRCKQLIGVIISGDFLIRFCFGRYRVAIRHSPASP